MHPSCFLSCPWDPIFDTYSLRSERFILGSQFLEVSVQSLVALRCDIMWQGHRGRKEVHGMASRRHRMKGSVREKDEPFHVTAPVTHLF